MPQAPVIIATAIATAVVAAAPAAAAPNWAPADTAPVHPGVQTNSDSGQCTANFVYTDASDAIYIGQAAHCTSTGGSTDTDGCLAGSLPLGSPVTVDGASKPGTLAYNSWLTMQANGETDPDTCAFNDLALIKLDPADYDKVNPSMPFWGGPTALRTDGLALGDKVLSYGNSSLRLGITQLSPKEGSSIGDAGNGWSHELYTVTPGIPGDSGSGFIDGEGKAFGTLSTVAARPEARRQRRRRPGQGARLPQRQRRLLRGAGAGHRGLHRLAAPVGQWSVSAIERRDARNGRMRAPGID